MAALHPARVFRLGVPDFSARDQATVLTAGSIVKTAWSALVVPAGGCNDVELVRLLYKQELLATSITVLRRSFPLGFKGEQRELSREWVPATFNLPGTCATLSVYSLTETRFVPRTAVDFLALLV